MVVSAGSETTSRRSSAPIVREPLTDDTQEAFVASTWFAISRSPVCAVAAQVHGVELLPLTVLPGRPTVKATASHCLRAGLPTIVTELPLARASPGRARVRRTG